MPRKEEDSLGQDFTRTGEPESPKPPESQRSLGDQSTFGDAGSSVSDVGGLDDAFESDMEVVDLSDRYEIEGTLGKGGMGEVQLATDTRLGRKVAIKRILGEAANSRTAVSRFIAEAKAIAQLDHDNIVDIYDYGRAADGPFLIMQFIDGGSLLDRCREGALPLEEAVELTCQLCGALEMAHDAGIIHRDIKPANVLMTKDGSPRLTDFGLVRDTQADHGQTVAGAVLGTIDFMPPEQRRDATLTDARSDLWALAATLYQMVTGKSPKIIRFNNVPQALQDVLGKALEEEKDDRYQTATEFRDALQGCLTAAVSAPEVAVDLGAGECPQCHAKNESSRKFCRGCGGTLVQKCLSCKAEMAVWENFCGGCGEDQKKLAEARHAEMASRQQQAEKLLKEYDYAAATQVANDLRDEPDSRFQQLKEWADQFLQNVDLEREQQLARIADLVQEALQHEKAYDYQAGIHTLEQVPEIFRGHPIRGQSSDVSGLLDRLQDKLGESQRLKQIIRQRVKAKQVTGLLSEVEALLNLQPNRKSVMKLRDQLIAREKKNAAKIAGVLAKAVGLRQKCRFEAATELLKRIPEGLLTQEANDLILDCSTLADLSARAMQSLATAIQTGDYETGLSQTDKYRTTLKTRDFVDKRFADEYESCQEASAVAERQQALRKKLTLAGALVTLVLLLGAGMWIRSSMRTYAISKELRSGAWDKVLSLDPQNVAALVGRAKGRLNSRTPDIDGAWSDLQLVEQIDASAPGFKPAWAAVHKAVADTLLQRAAANATDGLLDRAITDVEQALSLTGKSALSPHESRTLTAKLVKLPDNLLSELPVEVLSELPVKVLARLPVKVLSKFSTHLLHRLPPDVLLNLPPLRNSIGMQLKLIPAGVFQMGSPASEAGRDDDETQHRVGITKPFYLSVHEVTQEQYQRVMGKNPSYHSALGEGKGYVSGIETSQFPVEQVSWNDAVEFCRELGEQEGVEYRLPTEAEWEYACRAGTTTAYSFGGDASRLGQYAWYSRNTGDIGDWYARRVGEKLPNPWGLYDMHGNVLEWCQDWYGSYGKETVAIDPTGPSSGRKRVLRGGSFASPPEKVRSAFRNYSLLSGYRSFRTAGFRLARTYDLSP